MRAKLTLRLLLVGMAVLAFAVSASAQGLLPQSLSAWTAQSGSLVVPANALEQFAGTNAAVLREYGAVSGERREYARGAKTLTVTLYRLKDATGAYGAFTFLRTEQMAPTNIARYSAIEADRAVVATGNLLAEISGLKAASPGDLRALVAQLNSVADKTPLPTLGRYLPARGLMENSEHYLLGPLALQQALPLGSGDWLGFYEGAEAMVARYRSNGHEATLVLAAYPTPQSAMRRLEDLQRWFLVNSAQNASDGSREPSYARRQGSLLILVTRGNSNEFAGALLNQIRYETQVTWNEPSHTLTDPPIGQIVVGAIMGTGAVLVFALVAGIGFGGVRLVVKFFFPGKVFDRAGHVEILQLGLSSKPIEARDFY